MSLTHFWPGRRACLLLAWDIMPRCGFVAQTWGWIFSACGWTTGFSAVYAGTISLAICNMTASVKAVHRDPFLSYRTQWLNDSTNPGCFIAGVCGLPGPVHLVVNNKYSTVIQASVRDVEINGTVRYLYLQQPLNKICSGPILFIFLKSS